MNKLPKPYGWIAVGRFFTDRQAAISAAEKTPVIDVWCHSQLHVLAAQRDEGLAREELMRLGYEQCKQRLAEAEKMLTQGRDNIRRGLYEDDSEWEVLANDIDQFFASPGCADGENS